MDDILKKPAYKISELIKSGEISVVELVEIQLKAIEISEGKYNSYITILRDEAINKAKEVQSMLAKGEFKDSSLAGIPIAIKDNISMRNIKTTCASKTLKDYKPIFNARVIEKFESSGAIIIGKTNMDEFAMGSSSKSSYFGMTKNPRNTDYIPGGSSGGSAAAVAGNEAFISLGTDTGGSIRQPASYCGIVGLKPTYDLVSRYGLIPFASSLDALGPLARNVKDCAIALDVMTENNNKSYGKYSDFSMEDLKGIKIGVLDELTSSKGNLNPEVEENFLNSIKILEEQGAIIERFPFEMISYMTQVYFDISCAEASSNMGRYDGIRYGLSRDIEIDSMFDIAQYDGFSDDVKERILYGADILRKENYSEVFEQAMKTRTLISKEFEKAFTKYDIILNPTVQNLVPTYEEIFSKDFAGFLSTKYTAGANLAGLPAISIPSGIDSRGMPMGLQFMGRPFSEKELLNIGYIYEKSNPFWQENIITKKRYNHG